MPLLGITLGPDEKYVLVNESDVRQITRLWLKGPKVGQKDIFFSNLPFNPSSISFNGRDIFWVGEMSIGFIPESFEESPYSWLIGLSLDGEVVYNFQDWDGKFFSISSVNEYNGNLYLGSYAMSAVGQFELP